MRLTALGSSKDPLFRALRQLRTLEGRAQSGTFLIEQPEALRLACERGHDVRRVLISEAWLEAAPSWLEAVVPHAYVVTQGLLHKLFPTGKTPVVVAECAQLTRSLEQLSAAERCLVLEDIQDAGNLGSMLRTAEGLGVGDVIVLSSKVTDLYNRVAVRASMGSLFRLRLYEGSLEALRGRLSALGVRLIVTTPHTERELSALRRDTAPLALALGNESAGASAALLAMADECVRIPMATGVESLNVGAACAICLYALRPSA